MSTTGVKPLLPFDDDAEDGTEPFTAIGMLSWAVTNCLNDFDQDIDWVITNLNHNQSRYRW